jgi:DNA modification methylase
MTEADILKRYQDIISRDYMLTENPYNVVEGYNSKREAQAYLVKVYKENDYDMSYDEWLDDIRAGGYSPALTRAVNAIDTIKEATDEKRYWVTVGMMMYADNDEAIVEKAEAFASNLRAKQDNRATVMSVYENPFGSLTDRKVMDKDD